MRNFGSQTRPILLLETRSGVSTHLPGGYLSTPGLSRVVWYQHFPHQSRCGKSHAESQNQDSHRTGSVHLFDLNISGSSSSPRLPLSVQDLITPPAVDMCSTGDIVSTGVPVRRHRWILHLSNSEI